MIPINVIKLSVYKNVKYICTNCIIYSIRLTEYRIDLDEKFQTYFLNYDNITCIN